MGFARRLRRVRENYEKGTSLKLTEDRLERLYNECETDDQRAEVQYLRAQIYADERCWFEADIAAERALQCLPDNDPARGRILLLKGKALVRLENYKEAETTIEASLKFLDPYGEDGQAAEWNLKRVRYELKKREPGLTRWQRFKLTLKGPKFS